jgi:arylsulfatase A-like enzyme
MPSCLLLVVALLGATLATPAAPARPDVLVILTDQWSPRYVSWDQPQVRTPQLDRIAGEGLIFDACYTPAPVCVPARISLLTGLYPHNHGHAVWGNPNQYHLPPAVAPMFRDIRRAGYTTAQIGKLHWFTGTDWKSEFASLDDYHRALGLDYVLDVSGPVDAATAKDAYAQHLRELGVLDAVAADLRQRYLDWEYEPRASLVKPEDYHDGFVTGAAVDFIRRQPQAKPLCLVVSLHSPHPPLDAPGEFAQMFDPDKLTLPANVPETFQRDGRTLDHAAVRKLLANYLGKIALVDQCVGRLVGALQARGTWDGALVVFTADHGEMMGAHGALTKGRFYEEAARVPLVLRWPGHVKAGRTAALAQMMDIYPTIVEAIGGEVTPGRFAKSLLPVATGRQTAVRELVLSEIGKGTAQRLMARDARFKYWTDEKGECLFDLQDDPLEMHDLAGAPEHRETLHRMRAQLLAQLCSTQVNLADGARSKVQRLREAEAQKAPKGRTP